MLLQSGAGIVVGIRQGCISFPNLALPYAGQVFLFLISERELSHF